MAIETLFGMWLSMTVALAMCAVICISMNMRYAERKIDRWTALFSVVAAFMLIIGKLHDYDQLVVPTIANVMWSLFDPLVMVTMIMVSFGFRK